MGDGGEGDKALKAALVRGLKDAAVGMRRGGGLVCTRTASAVQRWQQRMAVKPCER
jgi:hypothetical protein